LVRPQPFVSYLCEASGAGRASLAPQDEESLRATAARCTVFEAQVEALKAALLEHHDRLSASLAAKAVAKWRSKTESHAEDRAKDAGKDEEPADDVALSRDLLRTNIALRLQLAGGSRGRGAAPSENLGGLRDCLSADLNRLESINNDEECAGSDNFLLKSLGQLLSSCGSSDAGALEGAMARINELTSRLAVAEARVAIDAISAKETRSNDRSAASRVQWLENHGEHVGVTRRGSKDEDEDEVLSLMNAVKDLMAERDALSKQVAALADTGAALHDMVNGATPEAPLCDGAERVRNYFTKNPTKVIVIPLFWGRHRRRTDEAPSGPVANAVSAVASKGEERVGVSGGSGDDDVVGEDRDDDDDDDDRIDEEESSRLRSLSDQFDRGWNRWQITDDDDDDAVEENEEGLRSPLARRSAQFKAAVKRTTNSQRAFGRSKAKRRVRAPHTEDEDDDEVLVVSRRRHPPIEVSLMTKYLRWTKKDKRVIFDMKKTLHLAHDILQKKAVQELVDERTGKARCSVSFFFEDYFFRNYGHLAKYNLRCFIHSLVHHKESGDRRATLFALIVGLHRPELYSTQLSCVFMRLIRGLFPDHKAIRPQLDKYDAKSGLSNCLVTQKRVYAGIIGPSGNPSSAKTWVAPEMLHLCGPDELWHLPHAGTDLQKWTDLDSAMYLVIDLFVAGAVRMQMRMKKFFLAIMEGSTAATLESLSSKPPRGASQEQLEAAAMARERLSSAHMHVTWDDFVGFNQVRPTVPVSFTFDVLRSFPALSRRYALRKRGTRGRTTTSSWKIFPSFTIISTTRRRRRRRRRRRPRRRPRPHPTKAGNCCRAADYRA